MGKSQESISFKEKFAYGMGDAATAFSAVSVASFSMFYFTDYVGVSATALGTVLIFTRVFDAITNIIMGYVVDQTRTKEGKARPWVKWAILPMFAALVAVFAIPTGMSSTATIVWITIVINIYYLVYTISNIPYGTLGTLISRDPQVRSELTLLRMIGYHGVSILLSFITVGLVAYLGGGSNSGWIYTMVIYGAIMSIIFYFTYSCTRERVRSTSEMRHDAERAAATESGAANSTPPNGGPEAGTGTAPAKSAGATGTVPAKPAPAKRLGIFASIGLLFRNKYWILIFLIMILTWILVNLFGGVNVYYARHILGDANYVGVLNAAFTGAQIVGFFLVSIPIRRFGRRRTIVFGLGMIIVGSLLVLTGPQNIYVLAVASIIRGLGFSPLMGTAYAMLADVIDYGEWKNGVRNEGISYSGGTFSTTVGSGLASSGIVWIMGAAGYISAKDAVQPASVLESIQFLFSWAPVIIAALLLVLFYFYDLDTFYPEIARDLEQGITLKDREKAAARQAHHVSGVEPAHPGHHQNNPESPAGSTETSAQTGAQTSAKDGTEKGGQNRTNYSTESEAGNAVG
ncbi:MFS transporter [Actinobaculum suis]|uniref:MFS transporter n=1 Tax=Actinobaculum suis TaxID=1657 RepID=UPI00066FE984|nr:MFS transporter [Actinobaculum suis]